MDGSYEEVWVLLKLANKERAYSYSKRNSIVACPGPKLTLRKDKDFGPLHENATSGISWR